jgi:hypothetical protein
MSTNVTGQRTVRPRFVWLGVVVVVVGGVLVAAGLIDSMKALWIAGLVVLAGGALLCLRGGIMYDAGAHATLGNQLEHAMKGEELSGVAPGAMVDVPEERAAEIERPSAVEPLEDPQLAAWVDVASPSGWVMLLAAFAVVGSEWTLMTDSLNGQNNGYIDTAAAIFLGLAGLRCLSPGVHPVAGMIGALAGVGLLLQGVFASEQGIGLQFVRFGCGGIAVVAGLAVVVAARQARRRMAMAES